ncbi:MAG: hypothetical protein AB8B74_00760 [Crocinitomicaceae bacterium]
MKIDQNDRPKINLKQHQRFRREVPWGLIRKIVIVSVLSGMIYYLVNNIPSNQISRSDGIEVEID